MDQNSFDAMENLRYTHYERLTKKKLNTEIV